MLNKIIKRSHRKMAKSDVDLAAVTRGRSSSGILDSDIVVNHVSRCRGPPELSQHEDTDSESVPEAFENLHRFRDVLAMERQGLFRRKVKICCNVCDFSDFKKMAREKEIKRQTLVELVDFIQSGSEKITELDQNEMVQMISLNIFRCLPPASYENTGSESLDPDEEEQYFVPTWPHLQLVYELLLRYVVSTYTDTKIAKRYIDNSFVSKLLDLFDSEDPREREYLKTILHRIYGRFMIHRPFIRRSINNIFYRFVYETGRHNGIGELLEILGSIINGFTLPMKEEHRLFLIRALIPLHKPKSLAIYHPQLSYCIKQFVQKDFKLAETVIMGLLKYWPVTNCQKEVLFLGELEEVLEATQAREFQLCMVPLFTRISRSICSPHFQVAERALFLWNSEHIVELISHHRSVIIPLVFDSLESNIRCHWNPSVLSLTVNVRRLLSDMDPELFDECQNQHPKNLARLSNLKEQREVLWLKLTDAAATSFQEGKEVPELSFLHLFPSML